MMTRRRLYRQALSPQDKAKKRELQLQQKYRDVREEHDEMYGDVSARDIVDDILSRFAEEPGCRKEGGGMVDPDDLSSWPQKLGERLHELMRELFEETFSEQDIQETALEFADQDLLNTIERLRVQAQQKPDDEQLQEQLEQSEEELAEQVEPHEGDAWYEAQEALEQDHWEEHVHDVILENFKSIHSAREFIERRYQELVQLADGGDVWRGVVMEEGTDPTVNRGLGHYWTSRQDLARPFLKEMNRLQGWSEPRVVRYHGRLDGLEHVNLVETLEANLWAYICEGYETDMHEVTFHQYAPIYVYEAEELDTDPYDPEYGAEVAEQYPIEAMRRC